MEELKDIMMRRRNQPHAPLDDKMIIARLAHMLDQCLGDFARIYIAHIRKESRMLIVHVSHPIVYYELMHRVPILERELSAYCATRLTIHCKMRI